MVLIHEKLILLNHQTNRQIQNTSSFNRVQFVKLHVGICTVKQSCTF